MDEKMHVAFTAMQIRYCLMFSGLILANMVSFAQVKAPPPPLPPHLIKHSIEQTQIKHIDRLGKNTFADLDSITGSKQVMMRYVLDSTLSPRVRLHAITSLDEMFDESIEVFFLDNVDLYVYDADIAIRPFFFDNAPIYQICSKGDDIKLLSYFFDLKSIDQCWNKNRVKIFSRLIKRCGESDEVISILERFLFERASDCRRKNIEEMVSQIRAQSDE